MAIFVNYRREDSKAIAGRIDDHLRAEFGDQDVYRDIDSIPPGVDFVVHLESALAQCDICLAIVGPNWVSKRLYEDTDFVRRELEVVLSRSIPIIPVLVEGATVLKPEQLPDSLRPLLRRNAVWLDSGRDFKLHVQQLIGSIKKLREDQAAATAKAEAAALEASRPSEPDAHHEHLRAGGTEGRSRWATRLLAGSIALTGLGVLLAVSAVAAFLLPKPAALASTTASRASALDPPGVETLAASAGEHAAGVGSSSPSSGSSREGRSVGRLEMWAIDRVVQANREEVKRCWDAASTKAGARGAKVVVAMSIDASGSVTNVNSAGGDGHEGLTKCIQNRIKEWRFSPAEEATAVTFPLVFAVE